MTHQRNKEDRQIDWIWPYHLHLQQKFKLLAGKFTWVDKAKILLADVYKHLFQKFVDSAQQCFVFTPQANFPSHNLNFHWRWWERIQTIFLNLFFFTSCQTSLKWIFKSLFCAFLKVYLLSNTIWILISYDINQFLGDD